MPRDLPLGPIINLSLFLALMIGIVRMTRTGHQARRLVSRVAASEHGIERIALQLAVLGDKVGSQRADLEDMRQHVDQLEENHPHQLENHPQ